MRKNLVEARMRKANIAAKVNGSPLVIFVRSSQQGRGYKGLVATAGHGNNHSLLLKL